MAKIVKQSVKKFPHSSSLKIFKFETSKYYYYSFYVGTHITKSGNKEGSLRTANVKIAMKKAKEIFNDWFINHQTETKRDKFETFTSKIAEPYFKYRIRRYADPNKKENQGERDKQKYFNYMIKFFDHLDYRNNDLMTTAVEDLVENLRQDQKTENTISKYLNVVSNMFNYAIKNNVVKSKPDFPRLRVVNQLRPSYFNEELNQISKKLYDEYKRTKDQFYLETKDYINLIRSAGFRPGIEPLRIKRFQYRLISDKKLPNEKILVFSIFNTKTKPKHQLVCHPYFTKNIFPEIENRHPNLSSEDYLLFPFQKNREKLYNKIAKTFTRISKELGLYYRNGSSRPIYSIRHTFIKNRYAENPQSLEVIARQSNTSTKMIHRNYLDEDDVMMIEEYRKMYPKK